MASDVTISTKDTTIPAQQPQTEGGPDGKKKALAIVRERLKQSRLAVQGGDPNREYYWAATYAEELSRYQALGWEVVKGDTGRKLKTRGGPREDGTHVIGDVILCSMPRIEFEAYLELNWENALAMAQGYQQEFIDKASEMGVPAFRTGGRRR